MSLRAFHIVFVTLATLMCLFLALWAFVITQDRTAFDTGLGVLGCIGVAGMPVYGIYFYRKARKLIL